MWTKQVKYENVNYNSSVFVFVLESRGHGVDLTRGKILKSQYSDASFIRTHVFPVNISGLTSLPDY